VTGTKRKADEPLSPGKSKSHAPSLSSKVASSAKAIPVLPTVAASVKAGNKPHSTNAAAPLKLPAWGTAASIAAPSKPPASGNPASTAPAKPPPKGSYADLMMKAKALQQQKTLQVGVLKHQPVPKEKLSKAEKKKRALEALAEKKAARLGKPALPAKPSAKPANPAAPAVKHREPEENAYKGTSRQTTAASAYKGTANKASRHGGADRPGRGDPRRIRPSRRDEYLATDEEDEGDDGYDDYDDYGSDESSDMEAGLEDVEREEEAALRAARMEDEEDIRAEVAAKKAKLERKQKLASLAAKSRH
jgi:hypothetical protein